ncbi:Dabb family protein [Aeoliella mucimassa]|uniref:Stress responsive A/B Barrel Domain protein n=1 Tax=Aeoliella mucimassa TaxID=2527972 RepID=A0A518AIN0_9BACT|nr:Dabb family protein [Aeoliella mucimassa]QDU54582.1 Stress responsive A/B Barrel Domain protein [Aeoliella mucimassa]
MSTRYLTATLAAGCLLATIVLAQDQSDSTATSEPASSESAQADASEPTAEAKTPEKKESMVRHLVLLKFKANATDKQIATVEKAFAGLSTKIDLVEDLEWGTDNSPEGLAQGFTHCFMLTFKSAKDRDAYLPHPAHKEFVEVLKPHLDEALVIDYSPK